MSEVLANVVQLSCATDAVLWTAFFEADLILATDTHVLDKVQQIIHSIICVPPEQA